MSADLPRTSIRRHTRPESRCVRVVVEPADRVDARFPRQVEGVGEVVAGRRSSAGPGLRRLSILSGGSESTSLFHFYLVALPRPYILSSSIVKAESIPERASEEMLAAQAAIKREEHGLSRISSRTSRTLAVLAKEDIPGRATLEHAHQRSLTVDGLNVACGKEGKVATHGHSMVRQEEWNYAYVRFKQTAGRDLQFRRT